MRVLFNLLDAGVGGGQQVALDIASDLVRRGHSVGVIVPARGPATERFAELGASTHVAQLVSLRRPGVIPGARIVRRYDIVYSHTSVPGEILAGLAATVAQRPHAVHRHVYPHFSPNPAIRAVQRLLYRHVERRARTVAVAEHVADSIVAVGIPRERIEVIPNGVDIPATPMPMRVGEGPVRFGLLGRLDPQKGGDLFVEAASRIGEGAEFLLGAPGLTDGYGNELLSAARKANVGAVMPAGRAFLQAVDVVVLPSRYEGHPLTLLEAMALGKPVVASAVPGIREVLEPDDAGLLIPPGDTEALAEAMRLLAADARLRAELGARGRQVVAERYPLARMHDRIVRFLEETAAARAPS
jgi:glycosyltransferase involved in cell wall biosynthesis